ncbi:MAG TPA: FAD-dependent oxidoreductase [Anaerolineae bacterium]|nr:FAD-dependent oxidoreductase [Anaerolineae bacterium]
MSNSSSQAWLCTVCGYVHYGPQPPDECPVCGAEPELFEPLAEQAESHAAAPLPAPVGTPEAAPALGRPHRVVIAGAGIGGVSAAESLRKNAPEAEIHLLSKEPALPYYRLNLTRYLAGEVARDQLLLHPEAWYREQGISLSLGTEVHSLDLPGQQLTTHGGVQHTFDRLILAVGSHAFVPPIPGADKPGVTVLRTLAEADALLEAAQPGARCVCIGGGILGLETAGALARHGLNITVVESFPWLLPRQLNRRAGTQLAAFVESIGMEVRAQAQVVELSGNGRVSQVRLGDGSDLPADLVVVTAGVRSNSSLARQSGLQVNLGIVVDDLLRTSVPDVFAVGDAAEHRGITYGLWGPAQFQGSIAGMNAAGGHVEFAGIPRSNTLKVLGLDMYSIGQVSPDDGTYRQVEGESEGVYYSFLFRDNRLAGAILLGDTSASTAAKKAIENRLDCSALLRSRPDAAAVLDFLKRMAE